MKKIKINLIALISVLSFTACQKDQLPTTATLNDDNQELAAKAIKKLYLNQITESNGNVVKSFIYNSNNQLEKIKDGSNTIQVFNYAQTGQLDYIDFIDQAGQITRKMSYKYGTNPDLPELMQDFSVSSNGVLTMESEVSFLWSPNGKKKKERTNGTASGIVSEIKYTYANGNLANWELTENGQVLETHSFGAFDNANTPYKSNSVLKLIPGFEAHNNNPLQITNNRSGTIIDETLVVKYNTNGNPSQITTTSYLGTTSNLFFSYVKL